MIVVKIQEIAKKRGINNGYQFQRLTGFPPGMAARIYKGQWKRIDLKTLNEVCNHLKCRPEDILEFTPDETDD